MLYGARALISLPVACHIHTCAAVSKTGNNFGQRDTSLDQTECSRKERLHRREISRVSWYHIVSQDRQTIQLRRECQLFRLTASFREREKRGPSGGLASPLPRALVVELGLEHPAQAWSVLSRPAAQYCRDWVALTPSQDPPTGVNPGHSGN